MRGRERKVLRLSRKNGRHTPIPGRLPAISSPRIIGCSVRLVQSIMVRISHCLCEIIQSTLPIPKPPILGYQDCVWGVKERKSLGTAGRGSMPRTRRRNSPMKKYRKIRLGDRKSTPTKNRSRGSALICERFCTKSCAKSLKKNAEPSGRRPG